MSDDQDRSPDTTPGEGAGQQPDIVARLRAALLSALGIRPNGSARAEIEDAIAADEAAGATLSADERTMLRAILRLGDMRVEDVMVPRAEIEAIDIETSIAEVIAIFRESGHSRMPAYRETLDDPVGMVHIRDLMAWIADRALARNGAAAAAVAVAVPPSQRKPSFDFGAVDLTATLEDSKLVRPVLFVPPSMPARALLKRMQSSRTQMALVIDEYGGTDGLVSLEDLVEIIVGEIEDEHDLEEAPTVSRIAEGVYIADARAELEDAAAVIGPDFRVGEKSEEVETIGGLVFAATGRIPPKGEVVEAVPGYDFEVLDADPRRIKRVKIRDRARAAPQVRQKRAAAG
jgi:CBS domain containing-hemolysin-like protein